MDKILEAYQKLFKSYIADNQDSALKDIKKVYCGDPYQYPSDSLPCLYIEPSRSQYTPYLQYDRRSHPIEIALIMSVKDFFGGDNSEDVSIKIQTVNMMEGTEEGSTNVRGDTIVGMIQKNPCLYSDDKTYMISNEVSNVSVVYTPIKGSKGDILYKASVSFTVLATGLR